MAPSTRSRNFEACATPSPIAHGIGMRSTPWSNCASRRMPSHAGWRLSGLRTAIRTIRRFHRVSTPSTAGRSIATSSLRCRREAYAKPVPGASMMAASSRRNRSKQLERLDHHQKDDEECDYQADDAVERRLPVEPLVGGAAETFAVHHLDLLPDNARIETNRHHDQEGEEDQRGGDPAVAEAPRR